MSAMDWATSLRTGICDLPMSSERCCTESCCEPARAATSTWAVMASRKPSQAVTEASRTSGIRRCLIMKRGRWISRMSGRTREAGLSNWSRASGFGVQAKALESTHQAVDDTRPTKAREFQGERVRPSHIGTELHLVKCRRQSLEPGDRRIPKGNTGLLAMHPDTLDSQLGTQHAKSAV